MPRITCQSRRGDVNSSSIVPDFFSSENTRMVSMGMSVSTATKLMVLNSGRMINSLILIRSIIVGYCATCMKYWV